MARSSRGTESVSRRSGCLGVRQSVSERTTPVRRNRCSALSGRAGSTVGAVMEQPLQGVEHVAVAQVPGLGRAAVHDAVVAFGGVDDAGVLDGVEECLIVALPVLDAACEQLLELGDHRVLAGIAALE